MGVSSRMSLKINIAFQKPLFKMEIVNPDNKPVRLWSFDYSEGYYSIYFSISANETGEQYQVRRKPVRWTINVPDVYEIGPGRSKQVNLDITDGSWDLSGIISAQPRGKIAASCILSNEDNEESLQYRILTGKYESDKLYFESLNEIIGD
jgi:hypothetical protein